MDGLVIFSTFLASAFVCYYVISSMTEGGNISRAVEMDLMRADDNEINFWLDDLLGKVEHDYDEEELNRTSSTMSKERLKQLIRDEIHSAEVKARYGTQNNSGVLDVLDTLTEE